MKQFIMGLIGAAFALAIILSLSNSPSESSGRGIFIVCSDNGVMIAGAGTIYWNSDNGEVTRVVVNDSQPLQESCPKVKTKFVGEN